MSAGSSPKVGWKWKWSNGGGKREMSIIWCISITNNVKSSKKITETAQTAKFTDFPLIFCGNGPKWTITMQTQTFFLRLEKFSRFKPPYEENVSLTFISEPKTQIVAVSFSWTVSYLLLTLLKYQTLLTLTSHNFGSKNYSNKNHHIFRKPWTSAFRWHTLDT